MSGANENDELPLGEQVTVRGVVAASTRFANGDVTYLVEFERKGRTVSDWFNRTDLSTDNEEHGGGI